jgi:hypothetical protein
MAIGSIRFGNDAWAETPIVNTKDPLPLLPVRLRSQSWSSRLKSPDPKATAGAEEVYLDLLRVLERKPLPSVETMVHVQRLMKRRIPRSAP